MLLRAWVRDWSRLKYERKREREGGDREGKRGRHEDKIEL